MALQVWLPLNGDLHNQGLSNSTTTGIPTFGNNGKIGQCLNCSTSIVIYSNKTFDRVWSFAFWGYVNSSLVTSNWTPIAGLYDGSSNLRIEVCPKNYANGVYCYSIHNNTGNAIINTAIGSPSGGYYDQWAHFCLTSDGTTIKKYINGTFIGSCSYSGSGTINGNFYLQGNNITYKNDVRLYDHCLSPKEVSELAKGLVLHYKLDDPYLEATTNLTNKLSSTCYNGATGKYNYGTTTDMYKTSGTFQGRQCEKVYMGTNGLSARPYVYINQLYVSDGTNAPSYKTVSFDYYTNIATYINAYKLGSGSATCNYTITNYKGITTGSFTNSGNLPIVKDTWNHIEMILHGTTSANAEWGFFIQGDTHTSDINNYWLFANIQVEEKDHATPYTPSIRNETTVYDSSGYNYNGTIVGDLSIVDSDAKYSHATYLDGTGPYINSNTNLPFIGNNCPFTVSIWVHCDDWAAATATAAKYIIQQYNATTGGFRIYSVAEANRYRMYWVNTDGTAQAIYFSAAGAFSGWEFLTVTYDGSVMKVYLNGDFVTSKTQTYTNTESSRALLIGNGAATVPGKYSDFRFYVTALSAAAVKELYETSGSVDNMGNVFAREVRE